MKRSIAIAMVLLLVIEAGCRTNTNQTANEEQLNNSKSVTEKSSGESPEKTAKMPVDEHNTDVAITNWRGPQSTGVFPETGLLKKWPENGPEVLWHYDGLGSGFSSPVFANNKIYLTGMEGDMGFLYILTGDGKFVRKHEIGKAWNESYSGSRSTPTVAGNLVYTYTGHGVLTCIDDEQEKVIWQINVLERFNGNNITWGLTESIVVHGKMVYCSPGGRKHNIVALNRFSGDLIWSVSAEKESSAYCTPILVNYRDRHLLVTMMASHIIGIDAKEGEFLWSHHQPNRYSVHANSPVYHDGGIFCTSGYGRGGVKLELDEDGDEVSEAWFKEEFDNRMGGAVLVDGYIYGSGDQNRGWKCLDWKTGELMYSSGQFMNGVTIAADGMLYIYTQRGELALVKATPEKFDLVSETRVKMGTGQHWAHPVIHNGRLFVRHGSALIAYKIK